MCLHKKKNTSDQQNSQGGHFHCDLYTMRDRKNT